MKLGLALLLCITSLGVARAVTTAPLVEPRATRLDTTLSALSENGFSGGVLLAVDDQILLAKGYGWADKAAQRRFSRDTLFDIGSITKQLTAAGIVKLVEQGKIKFSDPLSRFFPQAPKDKRAITIHQLLTHTAGFVDGLGDDFTDRILRDEYRDLALKTPLKHAPGARYDYSNTGYSILGIIIELVSGQSYEQFLRSVFFDSLSMTETGYVIPRWDLQRVERTYKNGEDRGTPFEKSWAADGPFAQGPYWHLRTNGGIVSTLDDMFSWVKALHQARLFSPELYQQFVTKHTAHTEFGTYAAGGYGYGTLISEYANGDLCMEHSGGDGVFLSMASRCKIGTEFVTMIWTLNDRAATAAALQQVMPLPAGKVWEWKDIYFGFKRLIIERLTQ
jgi:CubicO group peptidase (beta-lactamase class C family)